MDPKNEMHLDAAEQVFFDEQLALVKSRTYTKTHTRGRPKTCRRGHSLYLLFARNYDSACAKKTYSVYNLRSESRNVNACEIIIQLTRPYVVKHIMKILTEYHGHSRADAHEYVSSKACRAVLFGAVDTDYTAAHNSKEKAEKNRNSCNIS